MSPASGLPPRRALFRCSTATAYGATGHVATLAADIRRDIAKHGIRNGLLTSIAPTGTISLLAGNVSSGIEPIFRASYDRKILQPDGSHRTETRFGLCGGPVAGAIMAADAALPEAFVTAEHLTPAEHLRMMAAVQRHVDSSISKTINVPEDFSFERFKAVYEEAYDLGLKGCTTFRPNAITGSVLSADAALPVKPAKWST